MKTGEASNANAIPPQCLELDQIDSGIPKYRSSNKSPERMPEKGIRSFKKDLTGNSGGRRKPYRDMTDLHCFFCCAGEEIQVRECSCYECPIWRYRSSKCKLHRAMLGNLKKGETFSSDEQAEVEKLEERVAEAEKRVIALAENYCKQHAHWFPKAHSGKSRKAAIKAEELYLAYFDEGEVVPFEDWLQEEISLWEKHELKRGIRK